MHRLAPCPKFRFATQNRSIIGMAVRSEHLSGRRCESILETCVLSAGFIRFFICQWLRIVLPRFEYYLACFLCPAGGGGGSSSRLLFGCSGDVLRADHVLML